MSIGQNTIFAVSGGARGITASCVIRMAQQYQCGFILIGRTELASEEPVWADGATDRAVLQKRYFEATIDKPPLQVARRAVENVLASREIRHTLHQIRMTGGQGYYVAADVTNLCQLRDVLNHAQREIGQITGLVHGAGNLADKHIEQKTAQDFEYVYSAKIDGLKNLLVCLPPDQLHHLILFSSAAGFFGNPGQADYAIANEILNKAGLAIARSHPNCHVHSVNWGPWDGGMVTPQLRELFATRKIEVIPTEAGTQALIDELEQPQHRSQVVIGSMLPQPKSVVDTILRTHTVHRHITLEDNPFLRHHVIGNHPVLPMIHALNWIASTCEDLYPGYRFFRCENYQVLKGIVFDDQLASDYTLLVKEVQKDGQQLVFDCLVQSQGTGTLPRYHYKARIILVQELPEPPYYTQANLTENAAIDGHTLYEDGTLFHGPYLQGVRRVLNINERGLTLECVLPPVPLRDQGQFATQAFNPFLGDIQLQSMVIWARKMRGVASLPLQCEAGMYYGQHPVKEPFYVSLEIRETAENRITGDMILHSGAGQIYAYVTNGQVILSRQLNAMFSK
jgi:NAD(P)-dependent dehydrogenase (short-subunit alcohol dehydrogenase family)